MIRTLIVALALTGCSAATSPPAVIEEQPLAQSRWLIANIDGQPPAGSVSGEADAAMIIFGNRSYNASVGCNSLGGLFIERDARLYTYPGPQTAMGCVGELQVQETAINALLSSAPRFALDGETMLLTGAGHTVELRRTTLSNSVVDAPEAWQGSDLAEQSFAFRIVDGSWLTVPLPTLIFADSTVTLTNACPQPVEGSFTQQAEEVVLSFPEACDEAAPFVGTMALLSGPNGELLLAGNDHWLAGDNLRQDRPK